MMAFCAWKTWIWEHGQSEWTLQKEKCFPNISAFSLRYQTLLQLTSFMASLSNVKPCNDAAELTHPLICFLRPRLDPSFINLLTFQTQTESPC